MLTADQIRRLIEELGWKTVYEDRRVRLQYRFIGYSDDLETGKIQAALSVMLEKEG